jgi:hypothetical protein
VSTTEPQVTVDAGLQRGIKRMRTVRASAVLGAFFGVLVFAANVALGSALAVVPALLVVTLLALVVVQTRLIGMLRRQERELSRPRMTAEDYRHLRDMEIELGWEPSELPASVAKPKFPAPPAPRGCECPDETRDTVWVHVPDRATWVASYCAACGRGTGALTSAGSVQPSGTAALSGTGTLSAKPAWDDVAYPSEASQHFAQLAKVGRKYCLSYCPICAERLDALMRASILAVPPDLGDSAGDLRRDMRDLNDLDSIRARRWLEMERNGRLVIRRGLPPSPHMPPGAIEGFRDSAGREWCRDADDLWWIKPVPDGPWHRQDKTGGGQP